MRIKELLCEQISSVVYHAISFDGAEQMLKTNRLKQQQVSFTRSLTGRYHLDNHIIGVIFEFDGNLLNRHHKGGPVGTENWDDDDELQMDGKSNGQQEDRLITKNGLENISSYIKSAILFCPEEWTSEYTKDEFAVSYDDQLQSLPSVMALIAKLNIPFRFVGTIRDLNNKNANSIDRFVNSVYAANEEIGLKLGHKPPKIEFRVEITIQKQINFPEEFRDPDEEDYKFFTKITTVKCRTEEDAYSQVEKSLAAFNKKHNQNAIWADLKSIEEIE